MSTDLHRCQACGWKHRNPKAHRALTNVTQAVVFTVVEVLAAMVLDGWLAVAMWVIVARNVLFTGAVIYGLGLAATDQARANR